MTAVAAILFTKSLFAQQGYIKGKVKDANDVLHAATIAIGNTIMLSDQNGEFSLSVKSGTHILIITHTGYKKTEQAVTISAGNTTTIEIELIPLGALEEVVITGSRSLNQKTNLNSPVPIDVYSGGRFTQTGQISLTQMLNFLAPSFNASREVLHEPATLRGLDPQHVQILVNGIRYHNMAWLFSGGLRGQLGKGSVGNDLNSIPFPAIERIEVLRDGAAAQYGSDAIAGVINIILKKNTGKTTLQTHTGQYYKGDGEKFQVGVYYGFELKNKRLDSGRRGFMSVSGAYRNQAPTFRGGTYEGLVYLNYPNRGSHNDSIMIKQQDDQLVQSRGFNRRTIIDNAGNTKLNSTGFVINGGYPVNGSTEISWTTIINSRKLDRGGLFRFPRDSSRINYLLYPDGYQQRNKSNTTDISLIAGIKGKSTNDWDWEIKSSYGINSIRSHATNTSNASQTLLLGKNAPTSFYTGTDKFKQLTTDINFAKRFNTVNLAFGAEWRLENYHSIIGEESSWYNYDTINYSQGGIGAAGPENAVNENRNTAGVYIEFENKIAERLLFVAAGRYEYYSDFGGNIAGKLAARYKISKKFSVRASVNNGFRAPSLQQRYLTSISEIWTGLSRTNTYRGTFPNTHKVVSALNIPSLTAERTINFSSGITSSLSKNIHLTVDAYWIQIKNRIVLSGNFERRNGNKLDSILKLYPELNNITLVSFFTNAINTRTKGIDIIIDGNWNNKKEFWGISLAANFNSTRLYGKIKTSDKLETIAQSATTLFNNEDKTRLEKGQPGSKIILSTTYKTGNITFNIRNTRFGKTMIAPLSTDPEYFSSKILTDVSLAYSFKSCITITIGSNNIANIYPDRLKDYDNTGQGSWIYSPEASPFGFNGGYYFAGMMFSW